MTIRAKKSLVENKTGLKAISDPLPAGEVIDFNLPKNQSCGHAKKVKCSSTSKIVGAH